MELYDSLIDDILSQLDAFPKKGFPYSKDKAWADVGYNQVIMKRDTAFELSDRSFARISILHLNEEKDEQKTYNLIRKVDYVKYHLFPERYMMRTSSRIYKEAVRVAKKSTKDGIAFRKIGNLMINKYKENPAVKGITVLFITDIGVEYSLIQSIAVKADEITETLNHVMNSVNFDCSTCNLKPICDEVEGMKGLHFKNAGIG